jgi:RimJ/RimL family protein N-acetyltransferase
MREAVLATPALDPRFRAHFRFAEANARDAAFICRLRGDPELNQHLNRSSAEVEDQLRWLEAYKLREAQGREFYFVIVFDGADAGVVRMYDLRSDQNPTSFAWGSWIVPPPRPAGLVTFTALMIYEIGFDALGFQQAHVDVRKDNVGVVGFHLRAGAIQVGEDEDSFHYVYPPQAYQRLRAASAERYAQLRAA